MEKAPALIETDPRPAIVALDIPIGLPDAGRRACDDEARARLGWPRRNSVFPAPIRPALDARDRAHAARITERADGRRVGAQAWALYPKIRDVDAWLRESASARRAVYEVHPEVSFWHWNGGVPFVASKKSQAGHAQRRALVEQHYGRGIAARARAETEPRVTWLADDDILDAFAALYTAERIARGEHATLPEAPPRDAAGLPMRIVY